MVVVVVVVVVGRKLFMLAWLSIMVPSTLK